MVTKAFVDARPQHRDMVMNPADLVPGKTYIFHSCNHLKAGPNQIVDTGKCSRSRTRLRVIEHLEEEGKVEVWRADRGEYVMGYQEFGMLPISGVWPHFAHVTEV